MDELLVYGPWLLSAGALLLAGTTRRGAARTKARTDELERTVAALKTSAAPGSQTGSRTASPSALPSGPPSGPQMPAADGRASDPATGPCPAVLEERLGALEARLASLASSVSDAATPDADEVAPMRPPVPSSVEPVVAPRSGWRMFP